MKNILFVFIALLAIACNNKSQNQSNQLADDCLGPKPEQPCITTYELNPVCGCDGKTYPNPGSAACAGVLKFEKGPCAGDKSNEATFVPTAPQFEVLTVKEVKYGRDGYGVTLTNDKGSIFKSSISVANLGNEYKDMKAGDKVIIEGEYQESNPTFIMATKIIKQ